MLKILSTKSAKPRKGRVGVGGDSRAGRHKNKLDRSKFNGCNFDDSEVNRDGVGEDEIGKKVQV